MAINMAKGLVLVLLLVAMYTSGAQGYTTYITNSASRAIVATTSYTGGGTSKFVNRVIAAGTHQSDQYSTPLGIHVELWVDGAGQHNSVDINSDDSLVAFDHGAGSTGVDIYKAAYGTLTQKTGGVLVTIYLN